VDPHDQKNISPLYLDLIAELSNILHTNNLDVIILNTATMPELKYARIEPKKI